MIRLFTKTLSVVAIATLAAAQPGPGGPPPAPAAATTRPTTQPARPELGRMQLDILARRLAVDLQLDDAQRAKLDELAASLRDGPDAKGRDEQLRALLEELRVARDQNDRERVGELARQIRALRDGAGDSRQRLIDGVEPLLRPEQRTALAKFRETWDRDRQRGASGANRLERTVARLAQDLNLTAAQQGQFDALVESYRERFSTQAAQRAAEDEERATMLRTLREARDAGQAEKVRDIEQQLAERRDQDLTLLNEFLGELDVFLSDDQRAVVEQYRDRNAVPGGDADDVRTVLRAARRVRLEPEQRERLREIERDTVAAFRQLPKGDSEARTKLTTRTKESITALFSDSQKAEFEKHLSRAARRENPERQPDAPPANEAPEAP